MECYVLVRSKASRSPSIALLFVGGSQPPVNHSCPPSPRFPRMGYAFHSVYFFLTRPCLTLYPLFTHFNVLPSWDTLLLYDLYTIGLES